MTAVAQSEPVVAATPLSVEFVGMKVSPIGKSGRFRGRGSLHLDGNAIELSGNRVMSLAARVGAALFLAVLVAVLTGGRFTLGFIPLYLVVEHLWLEYAKIRVPLSRITRVARDQKRSLVAFEFEGQKGASPVVVKGGDEIYRLFAARN